MDYTLNDENKSKISGIKALKALYRHIRPSSGKVLVAFIFLMINSVTIIFTPFLIGDITNKYIPIADKDNLIKSLLVLGIIYLAGAIASYFQIRIMGQVGQSILFSIRNAVFTKLQSLPLQFFNQNKSGDLISRINTDTEKLNQAFSETILRFTGDVVVIAGIGIVMLRLNLELGTIALITLGIMLLITWALSGWIKSRNDQSLQKLGEMSGEIQESLSNFKVTIAFNRRDYFKDSFAKVNEANQKAATSAAIANGLLAPIYNYAGNIASGIILIAGIQILIIDKVVARTMPEFGTLLAFILYSSSFFNPLREMAELFSQTQVGVASWSRIYRLLTMESNLKTIASAQQQNPELIMKFHNVSFGYGKEKTVLNKINLDLERGKIYALVGPTGGGKSTTASLMVRLYDASEGQIFFKGKDIRSYTQEELADSIGFILQEPFLFTGTIGENIKYGNARLSSISNEDLISRLTDLGLSDIIARFPEGLDTKINPGGENISLGQKQLISFVRILLREPELLILDEATSNIDTVTEKLLEAILAQLPSTTTKVIIAHRLNTIEKADQIFFISGGAIEKPLDFSSALELIKSSHRKS